MTPPSSRSDHDEPRPAERAGSARGTRAEPPPARPAGEPVDPLPREQDAPRPLIVLLIFASLLLVGGAYYAIEKSGMASNVIGEPMSFGREGPIMDLEDLFREPEKRNLLGRDVALWRVPVEHVPGDYTFWVGFEANRTVPVVLLGELTSRQHESQTEVQPGDTLAIFGRVRAVREVQFLDREWAMAAAEWDRLERALIYISAVRVEHLSRAEHIPSPEMP